MNKDLYFIMRDLILKFIYEISLSKPTMLLFLANPGIQQIDRVIPPTGRQFLCY